MTTIDEKRFRCPECGGDTVREFCEAIISCDIVRFGLDEDNWPFVEEEMEINWEKTISQPEYQCATCGRRFETEELPARVAEDSGQEEQNDEEGHE